MRLNAARLIENTGGRDVDRSAENEWRRKPTKQMISQRCTTESKQFHAVISGSIIGLHCEEFKLREKEE
ncbi:uncharacterized protein LOC105197173 isoform X3 [Solenopsis invicta]|uniref:uncharacterized protein LOC105197173 isoform X3 n=1 Tax=Solenopsis invicta TaxID=13686 RepID=UPI00193D698F|nr:uncharacterized protein LOC105197173 isoform X3 [Solenopsis invicta]